MLGRPVACRVTVDCGSLSRCSPSPLCLTPSARARRGPAGGETITASPLGSVRSSVDDYSTQTHTPSPLTMTERKVRTHQTLFYISSTKVTSRILLSAPCRGAVCLPDERLPRRPRFMPVVTQRALAAPSAALAASSALPDGCPALLLLLAARPPPAAVTSALPAVAACSLVRASSHDHRTAPPHPPRRRPSSRMLTCRRRCSRMRSTWRRRRWTSSTWRRTSPRVSSGRQGLGRGSAVGEAARDGWRRS